jgi:adenine deaminase
MIAPGRYADIIISRDLPEFKAEMVIVKGQIVAEDGQLVIDLPTFLYPDWVTHSVHLKRSLNAEDFRLKAPNKPKIKANIIGIVENQAPTRHMRMEVAIENEEVKASFTNDLAKIALLERHHGTGEIQIGLVNGFGFSVPCAIGSTVAHDSHHMLVVGTNDVDMALAANELARINGGQVVVKEGKIIGQVDLPIAGLMSNENASAVAEKAASVLDGFRACGCTLNSPNMQLSLLALVVIPELRISNKGLVDVTKFRIIPLFDE